MELYELNSPVENMLAAKAGALHLPIGGTIELLPLCNMNCRMCYIRQTKAEMDAVGRMLTVDEWVRIASELKEAGVLHLLITGGEPLLYPGFREFYSALSDMGFIITINTNGTLINEDWAAFFGARPCRRLNITLYGKDNATYADLCNHPSGFEQVMHAAELLQKSGQMFRFTCSVTPQNYTELDELFDLAHSRGIYMEPTAYMFPPTTRREGSDTFTRLSPEEAANAVFHTNERKNGKPIDRATAIGALDNLKKENPSALFHGGLTCRAGRSGFWITWTGDLQACGMFDHPKVSLLDQSFSDAWTDIVRSTAELRMPDACNSCVKRALCANCGAANWCENGNLTEAPEYLCQMTDALIRRLLALLPAEEQQPYLELLGPDFAG